jgi:hypothetical protein
METTHSSETSVDFKQTTRRYIPEDVISLEVLCAPEWTPFTQNTDYSPVNARRDMLLGVTLDLCPALDFHITTRMQSKFLL